MRISKIKILIWIIIGFAILSIGALMTIFFVKTKSINARIISDMPETKRIENIDGKIYLGGRSCKVYCVDADSGDVLWSSFSHDETTWFSGGSVSVGNTLYTCTSDEHTIVAFDKNTGAFLRIYPTETNAYTVPLVYGENVIVAATDVYSLNKSYIMEFDTKNHTKLWQASIDHCVLSPPVIYQEVLYFGSDSGAIYSINLK